MKSEHPRRPFALAVVILTLLILAWLPAAWWLSGSLTRSEAQRNVDDIRGRRVEMLKLQTSGFADRWRYLTTSPEIIANSPAVLRALAMPTHEHVNEANHYLDMLIERTIGDTIWVISTEGRIVLASDADKPTTLVGRTLHDQPFFRDVLKGQSGQFFGHGLYTGQPGFYFSVPIRVGSDIVGVAAIKVRIDTLDALFGDPSILISDQMGVVVMSKVRGLLWHTLPGAQAISPSLQTLRYGKASLEPIGLTPASSPLLPAGLFHKAGSETPYLFLSQRDGSTARLTLHMLLPLPELNRLPAQQRFYFALIGGSGALALALVTLLLTYLRHIKRLGRQLADANHELQRQADSDFLTGCANRRKFERMLEAELARSHRYGNALAVAIIDIDFFKRINDSYGHPVGDAGLMHLVRTVSAAIREGDLLGRIGGEEFALMLPQTSEQDADTVLQRLRAVFEAGGFTAGEQRIGFTVSIGYAAAAEADGIESLLQRADAALYAAKQGGRNRVCFGAAPAAAAQPNA
ncbi:sensor domain-containing diguanylate cyclase [Jeongeupia naejangsanensis]|nr:sensor domain-containing diguanylate cyclase [Jeongeupia naejangsanensis]